MPASKDNLGLEIDPDRPILEQLEEQAENPEAEELLNNRDLVRMCSDLRISSP